MIRKHCSSYNSKQEIMKATVSKQKKMVKNIFELLIFDKMSKMRVFVCCKLISLLCIQSARYTVLENDFAIAGKEKWHLDKQIFTLQRSQRKITEEIEGK